MHEEINVGSSGWNYLVPVPDPASAFTAIRREVLANRDYYLFWQEEYTLGGEPATLEELEQTKEHEEFWEVGTHSILDMDRLVSSKDEDHDGTVRLLPSDLARQFFGTTAPTLQDFAAASADLMGPRRWSGFYIPIVTDGTPTHVAFWGDSGD